MWTVATYQQTGCFSLRPTNTTSSGGQTLLFPSPFAIKMALLDVAIRGWGIAQGQSWWPAIRDLEIGLAGPPQLIVNNTFIKIWRPKKNGADDREGTGIKTPLNATIAFRAFVSYNGLLQLAFRQKSQPERGLAETLPESANGKIITKLADHSLPVPLTSLLIQLNYLGKRGGFFQLTDIPKIAEILEFYPASPFVKLTTGSFGETGEFPLWGTLQSLDDCAATLDFAQVNVYDPTRLNSEKDRISQPVVVPYQMERSSRGYQLYQRLV